MGINWKFVALYGAYVAGLHLIDGPWRSWKRGHEGQPVDPWTASHVVWGMIANRMGVPLEQFMALGTINEAVEVGVRAVRPDLLWGTPESPANVITDMAANWAGWELANRLGSR